MIRSYIIFHLNLAYSSIEASSRLDVIEKCYKPLLQLIENNNIPIGIELTAWTLEQIHALAPEWVNDFKALLQAKKAELIGSGYTQIIGPLVPYEVNIWNQRLGLDVYESLLGVKPRLALVNEMAYSTGMVEVYTKSGYDGIIMDRDNILLALYGVEYSGYDSVPSHAQGLHGTSIPVLWSDSLLFQKLQRFVHGDSRLADYIEFYKKRSGIADRPLAVYCNDAEIFDYRPGRYREEGVVNKAGEWKRLSYLLNVLSEQVDTHWLSPSEALEASLDAVQHTSKILTTASQPIPVKKQAKYNVSRWAVTGRDDLWLNTMCHRMFKKLENSSNHEAWRQLCELWSSDLRTHITAQRWEDAQRHSMIFARSLDVNTQYDANFNVCLENEALLNECVPIDITHVGDFRISRDEENILLTLESTKIKLELNLRRGLAIHSLAFASHDFVPVVGVLPHGYFNSIKYGADFYSGSVVFDINSKHRRVTDLDRVDPTLSYKDGVLSIIGVVHSTEGLITTRYDLFSDKENIAYNVAFSNWSHAQGVLRVGMLTLLPEAFTSALTLETCNGGSIEECFELDQGCAHGQLVSSLISCTTGLGSTSGKIRLGDAHRALDVQWDPAACAVLPLLMYQNVSPSFLCRLAFSLSELDETLGVRTALPSFKLSLSPGNVK